MLALTRRYHFPAAHVLSTDRLSPEENLRVFVDVAELAPDVESRSVRVRWTWRQTWRESPEARRSGARGDHEELDVVLVSDDEVLLEPRSGPTVPARGLVREQ